MNLTGATYSGVLLGESLRIGATITVPLTVTVYRAAAGDTDAGQAELWTFMEFEVSSARVDELARALSQ